jgi:hypothetical protein
MARMVVGMFNSRHEADMARQRLLEVGFDESQIRVQGGVSKDSVKDRATAYTEGEGLAGTVEGIVRDMIVDSDARSWFERVASSGKSVVALDVADDSAAKMATSILNEVSGRAGPAAQRAETAVTDVKTPDLNASDAELSATSAGPRTDNPLPNSPTGWDQATRGEANAIGILGDPARPDGLIQDAPGSGTDDVHQAKVEKKPKRSRAKKRTDT